MPEPVGVAALAAGRLRVRDARLVPAARNRRPVLHQTLTVLGALRSGRVRVRALMLLVGTCGAVLWAARSVPTPWPPCTARATRSGRAIPTAAGKPLGISGSSRRKTSGWRSPPWPPGWGTRMSRSPPWRPDRWAVAQVAVRAGDAGAARTVIRALTGALKEPRPGVRAAAAEGLSAAAGAGPIGGSPDFSPQRRRDPARPSAATKRKRLTTETQRSQRRIRRCRCRHKPLLLELLR